MSLSTPFIQRPVGTTLLTIALALAGAVSYKFLPVSPLPQVDFPTISVSASLPGAAPETMASSVATPLERQFGRIAGVTEMTSSSTLGSTSITMQFDLSRNIDAAARDVQAAINAAQGNLPADLPARPSYRKVNPSDAPILILSMTSDTYTRAAMYDIADTILAQKLSQLPGVGQVIIGGGASPAVRVEVNPTALNNMGLGLEDLRNLLSNANANTPKGAVSNKSKKWTIETTDQQFDEKEYARDIITYRNGAAVRVSDVADVENSVVDVRTSGLANGKPAVMAIIFRQPGANIIDTVDNIMALMPQFQADVPAGMQLGVVLDRTTAIRASVKDTQFTLMVSVVLVVLVVFLFLRDWRSTLIPSVAVPVSLIGTFGVMYLMGYTIDNLSLMALTIATGFVVDDAIVVIENITRYLEDGERPLQAALHGAREIGFTVLSISVSLIAVFLPILLMPGLIGRLFREFAVVLSVAIAMSLIVSLTTTPMMCAVLLKSREEQHHGRFYRISEGFFNWILGIYERCLRVVLRHPLVMLLLTIATAGLTIYLFFIVPHGFFPEQDTGRMMGFVQADQDTSFQAMKRLLDEFAMRVRQDKAVDGVVAFTGGGGQTNTGRMFITLTPIEKRKVSVDVVRDRLMRKLSNVPGAQLYLQPVQDLRLTGHTTNSAYQFVLQADTLEELIGWVPKLMDAMKKIPGVEHINSDLQNNGPETELTIDRATAARLGVTTATIDNILNDAFGQRQVSTMYKQQNQYHVVMEVQPHFWQNPAGLRYIYVPTTNGAQVPLSAFASYTQSATPLSVNHDGQFPAVTINFDLQPNYSLGDAVIGIQNAEREIRLPESIHGSFAGTAQVFQSSIAQEILLIVAALLAVYIVLGMLYESYIHPITILSTIPSAGVGALLALLLFKTQFDIMGLIGIILLIGIVKKNAIMMVDFALEAERREGMKPVDAIFQACLLRFRPITMTTMAALLGGLPLALGSGTGSELRHPLGIAIVGGLIFSQMLTLFTTPVIYLYLDRLRLWSKSVFGRATDLHVPEMA